MGLGFSRKNMTDFIIYCDKYQFLASLGYAVYTARERGEDAGVLIKCGDDRYIVCETTTGKGTYSVQFGNPRPNPKDGYITWTVGNDETHVDEVDVADDEWAKPTEDECEALAQWFVSGGFRVRIPEYDLDFSAESEGEAEGEGEGETEDETN